MSDETPKEYPIGKGKPPKEHQFPPGKSGNPNGRPKGSKNVHQVLSKVLKEKITVTDAGKKMVVEKLEAAMRALVNKSFEGQPQSLKLLIEVMKDGDDAIQQPVEDQFYDDDYANLMEELDWIEEVRNAHKKVQADLDLSQFCAAPSARLSHFPFESDGAFPAQS